jgi:hypothetical protein
MTTRIYTVTVTAEHPRGVLDQEIGRAIVALADGLAWRKVTDHESASKVRVVVTDDAELHITAYDFDPERDS